MVEGLVVTILSCVIIVWVGFSMAGRDEARVSASSDLNKWYKIRREATIVNMEEVELDRRFVTVKGRGIHKQWGYKLTLEYKDMDGNIVTSNHMFYDASREDEEFLERYIQNKTLHVWLNSKRQVYVPGEIVDNSKGLTIYGSDKVLVYSALSALVVGFVSLILLLLIAPLWVVLHIPTILLAGAVPQIYMYIQTVSNDVQRRGYTAVSFLNQYALYIDKGESGVHRFKLVEQTLPMVQLEEGVGYLGYTPDKVDVLVDYDGNIPVHIASEYTIPSVVKELVERYR